MSPNDLRALTQAEIQQQIFANRLAMQNAPQSINLYNAMSNYRPPVSVPAGWADWYSCGDQLH